MSRLTGFHFREPAGRMVRKATILEPVTGRDETGGETLTQYKPIGSSWALAIALRGKELEYAQQIVPDAQAEFRIDYTKALTTEHRLLIGGVGWNILHIADPLFEEMRQTVLAKEALETDVIDDA